MPRLHASSLLFQYQDGEFLAPCEPRLTYLRVYIQMNGIEKSEIQGLKLLLPVEREFRNYRRPRQINRRLDPRRNDTTT